MLEQVELLGTEVVPVLRREMESRRAPDVLGRVVRLARRTGHQFRHDNPGARMRELPSNIVAPTVYPQPDFVLDAVNFT